MVNRCMWLAAVAAVALGCGDEGDGGGDEGAVSLQLDDCITDVSAAEDHVFSCSNLTFHVSVPEDCTSGGCGLIFDVHGFSMSGPMQEANTELARRGREHGYVVVHPSATPAPPLSSWDPAVDDAKVFDFMQRTIAAFAIDPERVHFTGFSQGGFMTWRFICDHGDLLASAAPAAGDAGTASCVGDGSAPPNPVPVMQLQGTQDTLVAYEDAAATRDAFVAALSMQETDTLSEDDAHHHVRYGNADGLVYEWVEHDYGGALVGDGHCFPGSSDPGDAEGQLFPFACDGDAAFVWGELVMQFFLDHPRSAE